MIFMHEKCHSSSTIQIKIIRNCFQILDSIDYFLVLCFHMSEKSGPKVLVPIAHGTEELEAITIIDTLARAGCQVTVAKVHSDQSELLVICAQGTKIVADKLTKDCMDEEFDLIACPGGPGAQSLKDCPHLTQMLQKQEEKKKLIAGICAAPAVVLQSLGILDGKDATCEPTEKLESLSKPSRDRVVVCDNIITSQSPGTALEFSLKLVEQLFDKSKANEIANMMQCPPVA
jgi:protein deglycase